MNNSSVSGLAFREFRTDIRPQDDLYRHVNGAWIDNTEIPDDRARWGSFHLLAEQAEQHVRAIVEEAQQAAAGTETRKIGDLYSSFMDLEAIQAAGASPLTANLARVDALASIPEFLQLAGEFEREGIGGIIGVYVAPDPGNPEQYLPFFIQGGISLPDESYYRLEGFADTRVAFRNHVQRMLELVGTSSAQASADQVLALETELAAQHWDNVRSRDAVATYNKMTWGQFVGRVGVDLAPWRAAVTAGYPNAFDDVIVAQPSFVEALGSLLTASRLAEWKAWLRFQLVHAGAPYLADEFVDENFAFYGTELTGVPKIRERWKRGVALAEGAMGEAIGREYVQRHFPPAAKVAIDDLVSNLIEAYRQSIATLDWMGEQTRQRALAKLDAFTPKVGHPTSWRDYSTLAVSATDVIGNVLRANVFEHDRQIARIGGPIDRDEWLITPQTVNAYYHPLLNEIVFPAAILQYPFFDADRDAAANYGGIGAVIGHELGHGFDDQGSRYDGDGTLRDWWTEDDRAAFEERTKALIDQYDQLVPLGLAAEHTVNGSLTIGENIGDLGGLGIAIRAYALSLGGESDPLIDGYTGIQRLLLSWGQIWQQKSRDAETVRLLTIDPHSPNEFRCNQILRNVDAFYQAFDVAESDALWLPPAQRVTIW